MDLNKKNLSCDLLIAGGGIGGLVAAVEAKENNPDLDVIIVEKQVTGYGGKANKGGGVLQYFQLDKITPMDFLQFHVNDWFILSGKFQWKMFGTICFYKHHICIFTDSFVSFF